MTYWASGRDPPASVSDVQVGDDPYTAEGVYAQTGGWGRYGGEGESGPSDYARKAWVRGMERRWAEEDEGGDGDAGCWDGRSDRAGASERGIGTDVGTPLQCRGCRCGSGLLDQHGALTESLDRSATRSTRPKTAPRRARRRRTPATGIVVLASGLLPFVSAAPAPAPPYLARDAAHSSRSAVAPSPTLPSIASRYDVDPTPSSASSRHALPTPSLPIDHGAYEISIARAGARADKRDGVKYLTSAEPPTAMPTATMNVPETALPYLLREDSDGVWTRVGEGWKLYGRQVGDAAATAPTDPQVTQTATWAVESALPPGWGSQSTRTDFYRVPLIVVAAVVLAVSIVVWIAVTAFKRRKAHRRQKRRAERLRRRALAAAGISEEDARTEEAQRKFEEKLDELQRERRMKKGAKFGRSGAVNLGRTRGETREERTRLGRGKVRLWTSTLGLRRRRGGRIERGAGDEGDSAAPTPRAGSVLDVPIEPKPEDPTVNTNVNGRGSQDTDRSTPTVPSSHTAIESGLPSREQTTTEDSAESRDMMSSLGSSMRTRDSPESDTRDRDRGPDAAPGGATYFPPAYRPASVRSLPAASPSRPTGLAQSSGQGQGEGSSSRPHVGQGPLDESGGTGEVPVDEKVHVHAPGYYPAPSTAEGEVALAVASRAEGKQRMPDLVPDGVAEGDEPGATSRGHVATDDKRILEQMRLAASAPPATLSAEAEDVSDASAQAFGATGDRIGEGSSGPSAPHIETDPDGFETLPLDLGAPFASLTDVNSPSHHAPTSHGSASPRQPIHPDIPLPPARPSARIRTLSMREEVEREVHEQLDELNLLPSAPPLGRAISTRIDAPSAPPDMDGALEGQDGPEMAGPSAPPMDEEEEHGEEVVDRERETAAEAGSEAGEGQGGEQSRNGRAVSTVEGRFLPRYEP